MKSRIWTRLDPTSSGRGVSEYVTEYSHVFQEVCRTEYWFYLEKENNFLQTGTNYTNIHYNTEKKLIYDEDYVNEALASIEA